VDIPESFYALRLPELYLIRFQTVSLTIPCVAGPYTPVICKLTLLKNSLRKSSIVFSGDDGYTRLPDEDPRFWDNVSSLESTITSTGQNDSGRPTPASEGYRSSFEGAGAISQWRVEIPTEFKMFDPNTISDLILHFQLTALDGGDRLKAAANAALTQSLANAIDNGPLLRLFSLRQDFSTEWSKFVNSRSGDASMKMDLTKDLFPYFVRDREVTPQRFSIFVRRKEALPWPQQISLTVSLNLLKKPVGTNLVDTTDETSDPVNVPLKSDSNIPMGMLHGHSDPSEQAFLQKLGTWELFITADQIKKFIDELRQDNADDTAGITGLVDVIQDVVVVVHYSIF